MYTRIKPHREMDFFVRNFHGSSQESKKYLNHCWIGINKTNLMIYPLFSTSNNRPLITFCPIQNRPYNFQISRTQGINSFFSFLSQGTSALLCAGRLFLVALYKTVQSALS